MADQLQFILVRGVYGLHESRKGMAAAVRCVAAALIAVDFLHGILAADGIQGGVEGGTVRFEGHLLSVLAAEHRAGGFPVYQAIHNGLDLGRHSHSAVPAGVRFGAADEGSFLGVVVRHVQGQQLRRAEAQIALGNDIVRIGHVSDVFPEPVHDWQRQCAAVLAAGPAHYQILAKVQCGHMPGDSVLVEQAAKGLHVFPGPLPRRALVRALLQIVNVDILHPHGPERAEVLDGCAVAVYGRCARPVGRLPLVVQLLQRDVLALLGSRQQGQRGEIGQGLLLGAEA